MAQNGGEVKVRIVTVAFENIDGLLRLLNSLALHWKAPDTEVIIYDNGGCREASENWIRRASSSLPFQIEVIGSGKNLGFSAAVNRTSERPGSWTHLLLLNPDAWLSSDVTEKTLATLKTHNGIVGLRVFDDANQSTRQMSARRFPSLLTSLTGREGLITRIWPDNPWSRKYLATDLAPDAAASVDWVSGCALWVDRESWIQLRGFDESYFLYVEDVDLGRKAERLNIPVTYLPVIDVVHEPRGSSKKSPHKADFYHHMGMWIYHVKWAGLIGWLIGPFVFLGIWLRFVLRRL